MKKARLSVLHTSRLYPQVGSLLFISVRVWVDPRVTVHSERKNKWNISRTPSGIGSATLRLAAQSLRANHQQLSANMSWARLVVSTNVPKQVAMATGRPAPGHDHLHARLRKTGGNHETTARWAHSIVTCMQPPSTKRSKHPCIGQHGAWWHLMYITTTQSTQPSSSVYSATCFGPRGPFSRLKSM